MRFPSGVRPEPKPTDVWYLRTDLPADLKPIARLVKAGHPISMAQWDQLCAWRKAGAKSKGD
jgi:hypothetical protein